MTRRVQKQGRCEVHTKHTHRTAVWAVVRDVTRTGEWSHQCRSVVWLGDTTEARPGARFHGRNRAGVFRWGRVCEIVKAEPYDVVWRTVSSMRYPDSTEWAIRLSPDEGGGTVIEQTFEVLKAPKVLDVVYNVVRAQRPHRGTYGGSPSSRGPCRPPRQ